MNHILPYAMSIEIKVIHNIPRIKAVLTKGNAYGHAYMYVSEIGDNKYSIFCATTDDFIWHQSKTHSVVPESEWALQKYSANKFEKWSTMCNTVNEDQFPEYFEDLLIEFDIVKISRRQYTGHIDSIDGNRLMSSLRKICYHSNGNQDNIPTIKNALKYLRKDPKTFMCLCLKKNNIEGIKKFFWDIGIDLIFKDSELYDYRHVLKYEKEFKISYEDDPPIYRPDRRRNKK